MIRRFRPAPGDRGAFPRPPTRPGFPRKLVVLLGVFAAWGLVGDVPGASAGPVPHIGPLSLTLEVAPTNGSAPLLVAFQASVVPAVPSSFQWSFGDGTGWTSSGSNSSSVTHLYAAYGLFTARVSVTQGRNSANATVLIGVSGVPLTASASAVLTSGFAPLTVNFSGRPHGGSGTYTALLWNFGDGDQGTGPNVQYTYLRPGSYRAELTVTDSVNRSAYANLSINVSMAAVPTPTESPTSSGSWDYLLGLTVAVMGVVAFAWSRRARPQAVPPAGSEEGGPLSVEFDPIVDDLGSGAAPEPSLVTSESPFVPPGPDPLETPGPSPEAQAIRVLLHLYGLGRLDPDELATPPWTQAGVAEHLGIRQNAASRVLRRLEAGGVVESRTRHVRGQSRRVKVYTLTSSGERLARDLRLTRASAGSPIPGSEFSPRETDW